MIPSKIWISKLSIVLFRHDIVSESGLLNGRKATKISTVSIDIDSHHPFIAPVIPRNSFESSLVIATDSGVTHIFMPIAFPQIFSTIIECVVVAMISFFFFGALENFAVHLYNCILLFFPPCIKSFALAAPICIPIPLREPLKIFGINNRILPLCERNESERLIERLDDCVAFHAAFRHWSSCKGLLLPAAF